MPEALNQPRALPPQMFGGIQGALPWANGMLYWPTLDDAAEMDDYDRPPSCGPPVTCTKIQE